MGLYEYIVSRTDKLDSKIKTEKWTPMVSLIPCTPFNITSPRLSSQLYHFVYIIRLAHLLHPPQQAWKCRYDGSLTLARQSKDVILSPTLASYTFHSLTTTPTCRHLHHSTFSTQKHLAIYSPYVFTTRGGLHTTYERQKDLIRVMPLHHHLHLWLHFPSSRYHSPWINHATKHRQYHSLHAPSLSVGGHLLYDLPQPLSQ